jgi:Putative DNA-binding domain
MSRHETQKVVAQWIRSPEGVAKDLERAEGAASDAGRAVLDGLIRKDATLDSISRLEIYANAYFYRILGVLSEDFAALRGVLGEALFHDLVTSYLWIEPPRHPSLRYAGERLAEFLVDHPVADVFRRSAPWAPDLAAFEWSRVDVFDAPDAKLLMRRDLMTRAPEEFASLSLRLGPCVSMRSFAYAVDVLWKAGMGKAEMKPDEFVARQDPYPQGLLIWRKEERVVHRRPDSSEWAALELLAGGTTFGELCEWVGDRASESEAPGLAANWLEQWIGDRLLLG